MPERRAPWTRDPAPTSSKQTSGDDIVALARKQVRSSSIARDSRASISSNQQTQVSSVTDGAAQASSVAHGGRSSSFTRATSNKLLLTNSEPRKLVSIERIPRALSSAAHWKRTASLVRAAYGMPSVSRTINLPPIRRTSPRSAATNKESDALAGQLRSPRAAPEFSQRTSAAYAVLNDMETAEHTARYTDSKSIWQALKSGDVQLISLKWLLSVGPRRSLCRGGRSCPTKPSSRTGSWPRYIRDARPSRASPPRARCRRR